MFLFKVLSSGIHEYDPVLTHALKEGYVSMYQPQQESQILTIQEPTTATNKPVVFKPSGVVTKQELQEAMKANSKFSLKQCLEAADGGHYRLACFGQAKNSVCSKQGCQFRHLVSPLVHRRTT